MFIFNHCNHPVYCYFNREELLVLSNYFSVE